MLSQEQILKHNLGLFAQYKPWLCFAKKAIYKALETPKIKHFPGITPLEPPGGLVVHPQSPAGFLGCLDSFEKSRLTKNVLFSGLESSAEIEIL